MKYIRVVLSIIVLLIAMAPILYGLHMYNWDISKFVMPEEFKPPEISIDYKVSGYEISEDGIIIKMLITDNSDFEFTIFNISGYVITDSFSVPLRLNEPVTLKPRESREIEVFIKPSDEFLTSLITQIIKNREISLNLDIDVLVDVYGAKVTLPLKLSRIISIKELGISEEALNLVTLEFININITKDKLIAFFKVINRLQELNIPLTLKISGISGEIFLETGESTEISLVKPVSIEPGKETKVGIGISFKPEFISTLIYELTKYEKVIITISATLDLNVLGKSFTITFEQRRELTKKDLGLPENIFNIEFVGTTFEENNVILNYKIENNLETFNIDFTIKDVTGEISLVTGEKTNVFLVEPVTITPGEVTTIGIMISFDPTFFGSLIYDLVINNQTQINLKLDVYLDILGSTFTISISESREISRDDLGIPPDFISVDILNIETFRDKIIINYEIYNNLGIFDIPILIEDVTGIVSLKDGPSAILSLQNPVTILPSKTSVLSLEVYLEDEFLAELLSRLINYNKTEIDVNAEITLDILTITTSIIFKDQVTIYRNEILPKEIITVDFSHIEFKQNYIIGYFIISNNLGKFNVTLTILNITGIIALDSSETTTYLLNTFIIKSNENATAALAIIPNKEFVETLFNNLLNKKYVNISIIATISIDILNKYIEIPIQLHKTLTIQEFEINENYIIIEYEGINIDADEIIIIFRATNNLPINISLTSLNATLTIDTNASIQSSLLNVVSFDVNETKIISLRGELSIEFINALISQLLIKNQLNISINGYSNIQIYNGEIGYPINLNVVLSKNEIGIDPNNIIISIESYELTQSKLVINISISNPLPWDISIIDANLILYYENGTEIAPLTANVPIIVPANSNNTLSLTLDLTPELYNELIRYIGTRKPFIISGELNVKIYDVEYTVQVYNEFIITLWREETWIRNYYII